MKQYEVTNQSGRENYNSKRTRNSMVSNLRETLRTHDNITNIKPPRSQDLDNVPRQGRTSNQHQAEFRPTP